MRVVPNPEGVGARVEGVDLSRPLSDGDFRAVLRALGERGVLCFPEQSLGAPQLSAFGARFGELEHNVANSFHAPGHPEVMVLSNMKEDGKPVGLNGAGQGWRTDMSHSEEIALANALRAKRVPARGGRRGPRLEGRRRDPRSASSPGRVGQRGAPQAAQAVAGGGAGPGEHPRPLPAAAPDHPRHARSGAGHRREARLPVVRQPGHSFGPRSRLRHAAFRGHAGRAGDRRAADDPQPVQAVGAGARPLTPPPSAPAPAPARLPAAPGPASASPPAPSAAAAGSGCRARRSAA